MGVSGSLERGPEHWCNTSSEGDSFPAVLPSICPPGIREKVLFVFLLNNRFFFPRSLVYSLVLTETVARWRVRFLFHCHCPFAGLTPLLRLTLYTVRRMLMNVPAGYTCEYM